ncbi:MAG: hypothetical protein ACKOOI_09705 [Pirellula sp.]
MSRASALGEFSKGWPVGSSQSQWIHVGLGWPERLWSSDLHGPVITQLLRCV